MEVPNTFTLNFPGREMGAEYPLSLGQRDVWMQAKIYPDGEVSKLSLLFSMWGLLDLALFNIALQSLVNRHDILRTIFVSAPGAMPVQQVRPDFHLRCPVIDCSSVRAETKEQDRDLKVETAKQFARELQAPPFDLANGPLLRARLLCFTPEWHCLVLSFHRMVLDGLHGAQLMNEFAEDYRRLRRGEPLIPRPAFQYGDFARMQEERAQSGSIQVNREFWLDRLAEPLPEMKLPADFDVPRQRTSQTALHTHHCSVELTTALRSLQKRYRATAIQIVTAAFAVLLQRATGDREFLIAVPCSTRPREMAGVVGFFSGILPLRVVVPPGIRVDEFVPLVSAEFRKGLQHREFPWTEVLTSLKSSQGCGGTLLPISVSQIGVVARRGSEAGDLSIVGIGGYGSASSHELSVVVQEQSRLALRFSYAKDLFDEKTIESWGCSMECLLQGFVDGPEELVDTLQVVREASGESCAKKHSEEQDAPGMLDTFLVQVSERPEAIAVCCGSESLSYRLLDRLSNQWAHWLAVQGMGTSDVLLVKAESSTLTVVSLLAALKTGASYELVRSDGRHVAGTPIDLSRAAREARTLPDTALPHKPAEFAYRERHPGARCDAVFVARTGFSRLLEPEAAWALHPADRVLLTASTGPAAVFSIWASLLSGSRLVIALDQELALLSQVLAREEISVLSLRANEFAVIAETIPEALDAVRLIVVSGGPVPGRLLRRAQHRLKHAQIVYTYSPHGLWPCLCGSAISPDSKPWRAMPVGPPPPGARIQLLDANGREVPPGVLGEIYVRHGSRTVPTQDGGRWQPDGSLEYRGSLQRAFRVEGVQCSMRDIEEELCRNAQVLDAFVVVLPVAGKRRLVAYVAVTDPETFNLAEVRSRLARSLPSYLRPAVLVPLLTLARDESGEVDSTKFPAPDASRREGYAAPRTPEQEGIAAIWAEVLGLERVGIEDNFFDLGGHSIAAVGVHQLMRERLGIEFPLMALFEHATIATLTRNLNPADNPATANQQRSALESRANRQTQRRQEQAERHRAGAGRVP